MFFLFTVIGNRNRWPLSRPPGTTSLANASQDTATKPEPAQLCEDILGLLLNGAYREAPCLSEQHRTALSCSLHPAVRSGKAPMLHKKEYFVSEKKRASCIWPTVRP